MDPERSAERIAKRLRPILSAARRAGAFICIDMEQYALKELTLICFKRLLMEPELCDWPDVGIAVQAYLRETETDLRDLIEWAGKRGTPVMVRLVRGAYWDYETVIAEQNGWPIPVWTRKWQTDACYERCLRLLLEHHPQVETAVATHNVRSMAVAMAAAEQCGLRGDQFEFQMLYGMAGALEKVLPRDGYRLRVYVPFGELLPGMAYLVRRLLENTSSQSFQRMNLAGQLSPAQLLASPHGGESDGAPPHALLTQAELEGVQAFAHEPPHRFTDPAERASFQYAIEEVRGGLGAMYPLLIDGEVVDHGRYIVSTNPARPTEVVGRVAVAETSDAEHAIRGAMRSLAGWSGRLAGERAQCLLRAASELRRRRDEFAALEIFEAGKTWGEADADVTEAIDYLEFYAREALRLSAPRLRHCPGEENLYTYVPRGVGLIVPPWNFPLAILTGMLSAAIVTGNAVILKPSSQTPVIAARFASLLHEVEVPPGVVQFLPGQGATLGEFLVTHPEIAFIAFTGSKEVGTRIVRLAAELATGQTRIKHVVAEMGGKNAVIVDADADLDDAVVGVVQSAFGYQGQKCSACSRVIVVGRRYRRFLERLVEATEGLRIGPPEDPGVSLGPVIEAQARQRIREVVSEGERSGARLALQCPVPDLGEGYFVGSAIFTDVAPDSFLAQEEIFGPVLAVLQATDFEAAIAIANRTAYALTGGLYSRSPAHIERARSAFEVGNLYINRRITGALVDRQPFGGFKLSGLGSKAGGPDYLLQFVIPRTITENTLRRGFAPSAPGAMT
jgi:RHH-type proline utilization regulon transcriptional repressor/proline dehydrogenase/delta 1-pyrroline-5-carboxylate dehydrogenase